MKTFLALLALAFSFTVRAQSGKPVDLYLKVENSTGDALEFIEVKLESVGPSKQMVGYTRSGGKVQFEVAPGSTYKVHFRSSPNHSEIKVPANLGSILTRKLLYDAPQTELTQYDTVVQDLHRNIQLAEYETVVSIYLFNENRRPHRNETVWLQQENIKKVYEGQTDNTGAVYFLVPNNFEYWINLGEAPGFRKIKTPDRSKAREDVAFTYVKADFEEVIKNDTVTQVLQKGQGPTQSRAIVNIYIRDLNNRPLENEKFYAQSRETGLIYYTKTDETGRSAVFLPKGDVYDVSFQYDTRIDTIVLDDSHELHTINLSLRYIGSVALEKMKAERARRLAIRDSLYKMGYRDSRYLLQNVGGEALKEQLAEIQRIAGEERKAYEKDPLHFEKTRNDVAAVLARIGDRWPNKIIVNDITGSMTPYMDQVLLWHAMKLINSEEKDYFFFNDGDRTDDKAKIIGQTGGIYFTPGETDRDLYLTMLKAMLAGSGGDGPENDLEAVLQAQDQIQRGVELVLIVDNYSDVKDLSLLSQLNIPVRIICCGADYGIHPHYLQIARKTGGSVHTIEEDLENLTIFMEGQVVTILGYDYQISHGRFIKLSDM